MRKQTEIKMEIKDKTSKTKQTTPNKDLVKITNKNTK